MKKKSFLIRKIEIYKVSSRFKVTNLVIEPDMLRYDRCYVCDDYPNEVAYLNYAPVTFGRWDSFLLKIVFLRMETKINPKKWYTYILNPRGEGLVKQYLIDRTDVYGDPVTIEFK